MPIQKSDYEELLATYCQSIAAIELLKHYRPYLEMVPSMRRPEESVITIPMPIVRIRHTTSSQEKITKIEPQILPCDLAILMCDPEWKIKTGKEIFVFIHRPDEDLSDLLARWRRTQVMLGKDYEWILPSRYQNFLNDGTDKIYPLFIVFEESPERIRRGLKGAHLPFVVQAAIESPNSEETSETPQTESEN
jgi:hypothetical protein